jgi:cellobiose transport system substrate-binding protein
VKTRTSWRPKRTAAAILVIALVTTGALLASSASATSHSTTLRVDLFGDFGYHDLYRQFEKAHPGVTIKEDIESYPDHHSNLAKHLATGAGADDVVAIEVGFISQFKAQPQNFVDLNQYGASKLKSQWLPWKWAQSIAPNGAQIGLGTDVGSMGICYRRDLMQAAGLPTSRDAVSKLWPTWADFIKTGQKFEAKAPKGTFFFDSGSNVFNAMIGQLNPAYYDAKGNVIGANNPQVKQAWNTTMSGIAKGESAGLAFSTSWNTGFAGQLRHGHLPGG